MGQTITNPQFGYSLYANLFTYNNAARTLIDLDRNWTQVWDIMNKLNGGKSIGFNDPQGIYNRPIKKRVAVSNIVATTTQQGANLVLTFADINYNGFRVKDYVKDDNMYEGRVILAAPGTITIEPMFNPALTFVAATHFAAGTTIRAYGDVSGNFNSGGKVPLYRDIVVQQDYSTVYRDTCQRARRQKFNTHVSRDGIAYLYTDDETEMVKRAMKYYGKTVMFGEPGTRQSPVEGQVNMVRGIRRSIIQDGMNMSGAASQITRALFEQLYYGVANTDGSEEQTIEVWMGRRAAATIQGFYSAFIQYAGSLNTFGGASVKGTNIMMNASAGVTTNWRILGCLNDGLEVPDWMQDSVYIMDLTPVTSRNESGQIIKVSPLQKIHWSANTNSDEEIIYKAVPGMTIPISESNNSAAVYADYQFAANNNDGYSCEYLHDFGISFVADRTGIYEYIH